MDARSRSVQTALVGSPGVLWTLGHGTADQDRLIDLLRGAGVTSLVDVRRFPGSRRHPHVSRDALSEWLPAAGIQYRWDPRLGGRRHVPVSERGAEEPDPWWRVDAFRAYAAHARTHEFHHGMTDLLAQLAREPTTVFCSETLWWRCHRRIIADVAVLQHGLDVRHLAHDGRTAPHPPAAGARSTPEGLVYDRLDEAETAPS